MAKASTSFTAPVATLNQPTWDKPSLAQTVPVITLLKAIILGGQVKEGMEDMEVWDSVRNPFVFWREVGGGGRVCVG